MATKTSTVSAIASARRAVVADRYAANALAVEWRNLSELEPIADEWRELAARVLEPTIFYEPAFALEAAKIFGRDAGALLVWSGTSPRKLLGFFPGRIEPRRHGLKLPVLVGWTHPYAPLGTPLVEREAAEPVIAAWLAHLADDPELPGVVLVPNGDRLFYVERTVGRHRHKELRRYVRRLGDIGALLFTTATEPETVATAIEDFFKLEERGWKGKAGTAASLHADIRD